MHSNEYILSHWDSPLREVAEATGLSINAIKKRRQRMKASQKPGVKRDLADFKNHVEEGHLRKKNTDYIKHIAELEAQVAAIKKLQANHGNHVIKAYHERAISEATAIACLTDVHIGERFVPEQVNGLNEYNVAICRERVNRFFQRVVKLTNKERQDVEINELVLFIGGDIIDGALHPDTIFANEVAEPMKQAVIAQELLSSGLLHLEKHGMFKRITVVCKDGNHGRITIKQHHASRAGNSLEWFIYYMLAQRFPQFNWVIEQNMLTYLEVYGKKLRFMHGDRIAFGGINGFYLYLHRKIAEWDRAIRADYTILGHLHQYTPHRKYLVNGSVPGYNPFAVALGADGSEPPIQAFMLYDKQRGPTVQIPILLAG